VVGLTRGTAAGYSPVVSDGHEQLGEAMDARAISGAELARRTGFTSRYIDSMRSKDRGARLPLDTARKKTR
jgi:hypothetical protein